MGPGSNPAGGQRADSGATATNSVDIWAFPITAKADATAFLRERLGERLGVAPGDVPIVAAEKGKPQLDPGAALADLRFNVSHSAGRALVAIADAVEVGVDIERITERRSPAFLREWCRREAYVKGLGTGLQGSRRPRAPDPGWVVLDLDVGAGYVGALAADSEVDVSVHFDAAVVDGT